MKLGPGYFWVTYQRDRTGYAVHGRSGLGIHLGPDLVEYEGWNRPNDWMPWTMSSAPRPWVMGASASR